MESCFLKNYDLRHLVFELLSGQIVKNGFRFKQTQFSITHSLFRAKLEGYVLHWDLRVD